MKFLPGKSGNPDTQFKAGQSGNPKGKPKGVKNWSTLVQDILGNEEIIEKALKKKPAYWEALPQKNGATIIIIVMMRLAIEGDIRAANWLRKTGYGDSININPDAEDGAVVPVAVFDMRNKVPMQIVPIMPKKKPAKKKTKRKVTKKKVE